MEYSIGDLIDLLSIIQRKKVILNDSSCDDQYNEIIKSLKQKGLSAEIIEQACYVANANADTWHLEADIRQEKNLPLEEVGRRAILIRDNNKRRIAAKNKLNEITKTGFIERKVAHQSA